MNKVYSFIELLIAIKKGKIEKGSKFKDEHTNIYTYNNSIDILQTDYGVGIIDDVYLDDLLHMEFTLIEENTIDEIEELDIEHLNGLDGFTLTQIEEVCINKQNELVRAVNKINKEIQELKDN